MKNPSPQIRILVSRIEVPARLFFFAFFPQPVCLIWVEQLSLAEFSGEQTRQKVYENDHKDVPGIWFDSVTKVFAKIRVFKVGYFSLPLFLVPILKSVAQNERKKHPCLFFLLLVQK